MSNVNDILSSELLIRENCIVIDGVVYERLFHEEHKWRFFLSYDDYDYVENPEEIKRLDMRHQTSFKL